MRRAGFRGTRFVVCISNAGYAASLERRKLYRAIPDAEAAAAGCVRVIDEDGEDYLYPADWFVAVELPQAARRAFSKAS